MKENIYEFLNRMKKEGDLRIRNWHATKKLYHMNKPLTEKERQSEDFFRAIFENTPTSKTLH